MVTQSMRSNIFAAAGVLVLTLSSACGIVPRLGGAADPATVSDIVPQANSTPVAVANPSVANVQPGPFQALVKRDSITQTLVVDGTVAAPAELPIIYQGSGKVLDIKVKVGDVVNQGDVMLELDGTEISRSLDAAQARAQTSKANLAQAIAQLAAQQNTAAQRAAAARQQQQQTIADAQAGLRKAQAQLDTVMAGATDADRHVAENALANAQTVLQKAQDAQNALGNGPNPVSVHAAQLEVNSDQIALDKANADLNTLLRGPDQIVLDQAQRDIDRDTTALQLAQQAKLDPKQDPTAAKLTHDSAVADAQVTLQTAQAKLSTLKQPPADYDVQTARQKVQIASDALAIAQAKLVGLGQPPDQPTLDAAQAAVDTAQQGVDDAQAKLDLVNSHPTPNEAADAQDQVRRAQAALDAARSPVQTSSDPGGVDLGSLQQAVAQDDADVASLQQQLDAMQIVAPSSGTVLSVRAKPGDTITSAKPVFTLAQAGQPIVRVQLSDDEAKQLAKGQKATIVIDPTSAANPVPATVTTLVTAADSGGSSPSADFQVNWASGAVPKFGLPVSVTVTVLQKSDVLVVPKSALRQTAGQSYVEVIDGVTKKITNVQVGITSDTAAEIVSGLTEGQLVATTTAS